MSADFRFSFLVVSDIIECDLVVFKTVLAECKYVTNVKLVCEHWVYNAQHNTNDSSDSRAGLLSL